MSATQVKNTSFFRANSIAGCALWLDGADPAASGVVPSNGSVLTTWIDKSGNSKNATGVSSPTVVTNAVNSKSAVSYIGSYSYSTIASGTFSTAMNNFFVYKVNGAVTYMAPMTRGQGNTGSPIDQYNTTRLLGGGSYNGFTSAYSHASATSTTLFTQLIQQSPSTVYNEYVNGSTTSSLSATGFSASDSASFVYIGTRDDKVTSFNGYMCELIVYNVTMTLAQQQQIEGYLAWKWGLQGSLPPTHPYYTDSSSVTALALYYPRALATIIGTNQKHPLTIAGISLWLDGLDITGTGSRYPTGTTVTTWADKSGNQRNATASSGGVNYTMTFGIYPGLIFTNSQYLLGSISITGNTLSIFSIFSQANQETGGAGRIIALAATGQNDYNSGSYMGLLRQSGLSFGPYRNGTFTGNTLSGYDTPTIMEAWYDGTNQNSTINGGLTPLSNASSGNFAISAYAVANNTNLGDVPNGPLYGSIGEVIVYNISPTLLQRQLIEGYLAWKWGIQSSLASGHPYQTVPPSYPPFTPPVVRSIVNRSL